MKFRKLLLASIVAALFAACDSTGDSYVVGDVFSDNLAVLGYVDTFSLQLSTIRIDSFVTSGHSDFFFGYYKDEQIGNVLTETYIPLVMSKKVNISEYAKYDSLVICFKPKGGWIGDTISEKELKVYEVLEEIKPDVFANVYSMFNNQRLKRSDNCIATIKINPNPKNGLVSYGKMSDSLGMEWFEKLRLNDDVMDNNVDFQRYFRGICVVPQTTEFTWGLDFIGSPSGAIYNTNTYSIYAEYAPNFEIRLYYRQPDDLEDDSYISFVLDEERFAYNHYVNDRSGTAFEQLPIDGGKIRSSESNNMSYIQTGSGLALKIDFPSLFALRTFSEYVNVVDARLVIKPQDKSFDELYQLPSCLYVAVTDESNELYGNLTDIRGNVIYSPIYYEDDRRETPFYSFSVLSFIRSRIKSPTEDFSSLVILPSDAENSMTFRRLVVDDNTTFGENVQLQVYYVTY